MKHEITPLNEVAFKDGVEAGWIGFEKAPIDLISPSVVSIAGASFVDAAEAMKRHTFSEIVRPAIEAVDPGLQVYTLNDVVIAGQRLIVLQNKWLLSNRISGTGAEHLSPTVNEAITQSGDGTLALNLDPLSAETMPGRYFVVSSAGVEMYHHWMIDLMPRIVALARNRNYDDVIFLVAQDAPRYVLQTMRLLNLPASRLSLFDPNRIQRVEHLVVCPVPNFDLETCAASALALMRETLLRSVPSIAHFGEKILFTRQDVSKSERILLNEQKLIDALCAEGFTAIAPSSLSVAEQIGVMKTARTIACVHGSAGANLIFAGPQAKTLHLFPDCLTYFHSHAIASFIAGSKYAYVFGVSFQRGARAHNSPWILSPDRVLAALDRLSAI